jgi:hypothetical protein
MFTMRMDMNSLHVGIVILMVTWLLLNGDGPPAGTTKRIHCCSQNHTAPDYQGGNSEVYQLERSLSKGYLLISLPLQFNMVCARTVCGAGPTTALSSKRITGKS